MLEPLQDKNWQLLDIPDGRSGNFYIEHSYHRKGAVYNTANLRCVLFGQENAKIKFSYPHKWHKLCEQTNDKNNVWMTDLPCEQVQHDQALDGFSGSVLVGGLGLGYAVSRLISATDTTEITVVEKSSDVIKLVWDHVIDVKGAETKRLEIVHGDLQDYITTTTNKFDYAFYDIWASDGEFTMLGTVVPLLRTTKDRGIVPIDNVKCWNEDVMRGQLLMSLQSVLFTIMTGAREPNWLLGLVDGSVHHAWMRTFVLWLRENYKTPDEMNKDSNTIWEKTKDYTYTYARHYWGT